MAKSEMASAFPFRDSAAAQMLKVGLERNSAKGVSLRALAKLLNYKQAVVLSHMSNGRVPVPLERTLEIAVAVALPTRRFAIAVIEQRAPELAKQLRDAGAQQETGFLDALEKVAGAPLDSLGDEQKMVLLEAAADPNAGRRWVSVPLLPAVMLLRELKPNAERVGLSARDQDCLVAALSGEP